MQLNYLKKRYLAKFNVTSYGCGGGTIFNAEKFCNKYYKIHEFIDTEFDTMYSLDHKIGWLDMFTQVIYHTMKSEYSINTQISDYREGSELNQNFSILNQYKKYY